MDGYAKVSFSFLLLSISGTPNKTPPGWHPESIYSGGMATLSRTYTETRDRWTIKRPNNAQGLD